MGLIPGSGKSPGEENSNPLLYSCLGNPMDRGAWQATVHGVSRVGHSLVTKPPPLESKTFFQVAFLIYNYRISTSNSSLKFHTKQNVLVEKSGLNITVLAPNPVSLTDSYATMKRTAASYSEGSHGASPAI